MEVAAALLTFFVVLASAGGAGKPASPKTNEQHNVENNTTQLDDRQTAICDSNKPIYRDLTVPYTQQVDAPKPKANEGTE